MSMRRVCGTLGKSSKAPQKYAPFQSLGLDAFFQPKLQRASAVGGRPVRDASDVLAHKSDQLRVFEVLDEKLALHLHDLLLSGGDPRENFFHGIVQ